MGFTSEQQMHSGFVELALRQTIGKYEILRGADEAVILSGLVTTSNTSHRYHLVL